MANNFVFGPHNTPAAPAVTPAPAVPPTTPYNAHTINVDKNTQTVEGRLQGLLNEANPLMRQAKASAMNDMSARGLLNSSLATTAGYSAMLKNALPIAQHDADVYTSQAQKNQDYVNQALLTNTNWANKFGEDSFVTKMDFWNKSNQQAQVHNQAVDTLNRENQWKADLLAQEYGLKNELQKLQNSSSLTNKYLETYKELTRQLNAVLVDKNVDAGAKKAIVNNFVAATNKLSSAIRAMDVPIPGFDFNDYYAA